MTQEMLARFALAPGELAWCSDVASLIDGGDTVEVIVSDGDRTYRNPDHARVHTKDGGRQSLDSCTKDETPTSARTDLPRDIRPDDPLPTSAKDIKETRVAAGLKCKFARAGRVHASLLWQTRPQRSPIAAEIRASGI